MAKVTALRAERGGRVTVELDGDRWRTLPLAAVAAAGLAPGVELDRPRARQLRREVRRAEALAASLGALERRALSAHALAARLERRGIAREVRESTLDALKRGGLLDDERLAVARAASLAERGRGDAAIRWELEQAGIERHLIEPALARLEPERVRAERVVERSGEAGARVARLLARRGFGADAVEHALAGLPGAEG